MERFYFLYQLNSILILGHSHSTPMSFLGSAQALLFSQANMGDGCARLPGCFPCLVLFSHLAGPCLAFFPSLAASTTWLVLCMVVSPPVATPCHASLPVQNVPHLAVPCPAWLSSFLSSLLLFAPSPALQPDLLSTLADNLGHPTRRVARWIPSPGHLSPPKHRVQREPCVSHSFQAFCEPLVRL